MTMQPDDLKALRQSAGLSQQALADAIGMSRKAVNEMEAGKTPIEKRTALAVTAVVGTARQEAMPAVAGKGKTAPPLERAARALCRLDGNPENATMDGKPLWQDYLPEAWAVIEAIREPGDGALGQDDAASSPS